MVYIFQRPLQSTLKMIKNYLKLPYLYRSLTTSKSLAGNYEGDGKTTVTILNREQNHLIMIDTYSNLGFRLNNRIFTVGPLAAFPRTVLQWNINNVADITQESLSLFHLLEPKLDILIIGTGNERILPGKGILEYLKSNRINTEFLSTDKACALFNFLNAEGRCVAGGFIPPDALKLYQDETLIMTSYDAIDDYSEVPTGNKITK